MSPDWINALIGGVLIGTAASLMLLWNGRITGVSGIISSAISRRQDQGPWRLTFLMGLIVGGIILLQFDSQALENELNISVLQTIVAGLLVGFGTVMGSGCTSGHGICGVSRLSPRSIIATLIFIFSGIATVYICKSYLGDL